MPEYKGAESHKAETATTLFIFTGWDPILQEVRDTQTYKATYKENLKELTVTLKYDDKETTLTVGYNQALDETKVPVPAKSDMNFGGWYTKDDQKWELADPVTQSMILYARYYEKSEPAIINGKEVMAAANDLEDKTINNRYNDKPLVIWTNNGIIVLPAHLKSSVTIPKISNEDNVVTFSNDITRNLDMDTNGHMFGIFLKVSYNRTINDNIVSENRKRNYQEVTGSGFDAEFRQILDNKGNTSHFDYLGTVTLSIDLKAMGISLPEASPAMSRTFYAAHNYAGTSVEYLPLSLSADKGKGTVIVSTLSPFAIVYKDSERTKPSSPSYKLPKTGD